MKVFKCNTTFYNDVYLNLQHVAAIDRWCAIIVQPSKPLKNLRM